MPKEKALSMVGQMSEWDSESKLVLGPEHASGEFSGEGEVHGEVTVIQEGECEGCEEDRFVEVVLPMVRGVVIRPAFGNEEEVKMDPTIFMSLCNRLLVTQCIDLFASEKHHQLPRYFTLDKRDKAALGYNAFSFVWSPEVCLYANPP